MATTIQKYLEQATAAGINTKSKESIQWFKANVNRATSTKTNTLMREEKAALINSWTNVGMGKMYMAHYDPKHKDTLSYYDTFPLIIPIERYADGFLGMNLHYLPINLRAKLLDALLDTMNNQSFNEKTKMKVTYELLSSASRFKYFQPCLKRYLGDHFRSRFLQVYPEAWPLATFLPTENFEKATKMRVWKDSRGMISK